MFSYLVILVKWINRALYMIIMCKVYNIYIALYVYFGSSVVYYFTIPFLLLLIHSLTFCKFKQ